MQGQEMATRWAIMRLKDRLEALDTDVTDGNLDRAYGEARDIIDTANELLNRVAQLRDDTLILQGVSNA